MRHNNSQRRNNMRHRNNGGGQQRRGFQNKNRVYDSNGPDVRIRGTAFQIVEKYVALAKDAASAGDRVVSESYLQHAEHYQRMINQWAEEWGGAEDYSDSNPYERFEIPPAAGVKADEEAAEDLSLPASIIGVRGNAPNEQNEMA